MYCELKVKTFLYVVIMQIPYCFSLAASGLRLQNLWMYELTNLRFSLQIDTRDKHVARAG